MLSMEVTTENAVPAETLNSQTFSEPTALIREEVDIPNYVNVV